MKYYLALAASLLLFVNSISAQSSCGKSDIVDIITAKDSIETNPTAQDSSKLTVLDRLNQKVKSLVADPSDLPPEVKEQLADSLKAVEEHNANMMEKCSKIIARDQKRIESAFEELQAKTKATKEELEQEKERSKTGKTLSYR